jgi:HSP20 family protein
MSPLLPVLSRERRPYRDMDDVHQHMDRVFQQLLDPAALLDQAAWIPPFDIEETEDAWLIEADLPGVKRDDVTVEMQGEELVVRGEIKERERKGIVRRRTRRIGEFEFRVRLPGDVEEAGIDANLSHGVLTVRIPKARAPQARRITVSGDE